MCVAVPLVLLVGPHLPIRAPLGFLLLPALAIVAMKLVEWRVARWVRRWEERDAARKRIASSRR